MSHAAGRIHVAGVLDDAEARLLIDCQVDCLGIPLVLAHHPQDLTVQEAAGIVRQFGDRARFFVITYLVTAREILALCREVGVSMVQLHATVARGELERLGSERPRLTVLKSLIVRDDNLDALFDELEEFAPLVDGFITDTHDPETGADGATGRTHDWSISRRLAERSPRPLVLAGGLVPENVHRAVLAVRPAAVDAHTGVEGPDGRKTEELVRGFVDEARRGFTEIS